MDRETKQRASHRENGKGNNTCIQNHEKEKLKFLGFIIEKGRFRKCKLPARGTLRAI